MSIDWVTVSAQILNFLVLIWLLNKLLYKPVLKVISEREAFVRTNLQNAEALKQEADQLRVEVARDRDKLEATRDDLLQKARDEVTRLEREGRHKAREAGLDEQKQWQDTLAIRKHEMSKAIAARTTPLVIASAQKCLSDLATEDVQDATIRRFLKALQSLSGEDRTRLATFLSSDEINIVLPRTPKASVLKTIRSALRDIAQTAVNTKIVIDGKLTLGIVLKSNNQTYDWTVDRYLEGLEQNVLNELNQTLSSQAGVKQL
ncbi:MAG: hypothetical protein QNI84_12385 [Henriciella sp.]|nr:hypothetical protein [Henriciella sp.]